MYDLVIVGAGLIGSASARHASSSSNLKLCLIGPDEPHNRDIDNPRDVFGAHYDEGRITRATDPDVLWSVLARRSIDRYRELERISGITFYEERGFLSVGPKDESYIEGIKVCVSSQNIKYDSDSTQLRKRFPYLDLPPNEEWIFETSQAGYINPRGLVKAQQKLALKNGCDIVREVVKHVVRSVDDDGEYIMKITTDSGSECFARKVLIATGAFTMSRDLLGKEVELDVELNPVTVCLAEIDESDAEILRMMPPFVYLGGGNPGWWDGIPSDDRGHSGCYMLPPIRYPDGKYYLKLGTICKYGQVDGLQTAADLKSWYCKKGPAQLVKALGRLLKKIVPGVTVKSFHGDSCVFVETPSVRPYIAMIHSQLGLVTGGNGVAAKSSDEIGRIAAQMITDGQWDEDLTADMFQVRYKMHGSSKL